MSSRDGTLLCWPQQTPGSHGRHDFAGMDTLTDGCRECSQLPSQPLAKNAASRAGMSFCPAALAAAGAGSIPGNGGWSRLSVSGVQQLLDPWCLWALPLFAVPSLHFTWVSTCRTEALTHTILLWENIALQEHHLKHTRNLYQL